MEAYGSLQVEFLEEKKEDHQIVRTFHLSMEGSTGRQIKQYHFIAWPDHGVPSSSEALLEFVDQVKDKYNVADGPTVVHCRLGDMPIQNDLVITTSNIIVLVLAVLEHLLPYMCKWLDQRRKEQLTFTSLCST